MVHIPVVRDIVNNKLTFSIRYPFPVVNTPVVDYNGNRGVVVGVDIHGEGVTIDWDTLGVRVYRDIEYL